MELNDSLYKQIVELSEQGDILVENGDFNNAVNKYQMALELLPGSKYEWEAATWLYTALGDTYYLMEHYEEALQYLKETLKCPEGNDNPFVLLRMGEVLFEVNNIVGAKEYLLRAFILEGKEIFEGEPEKYINLIEKIVMLGVE